MMRKGILSMLSFIVKPCLVILLIFGVFGVVYIRSSFLRLEYSLGELERKKMNDLKERKILLAEKISLLSFAKFEGDQMGNDSFILPDRIKVIHVDRQKRYLPYKASLERKQLSEP
jgi:hypothetical protein